MKSILVTGGAGFIGSNFVRMVLDEHPEARVVNLDKLTYAGNLQNLAEVQNHPRYAFVQGDICDGPLVERLLVEHKIDTIVNFAAESHVDRSITGPKIFIDTNVTGTLTLLQAARDKGLERFLQVSTDEVYGSLGSEGKFTEQTPLSPNSPYSASKASADHLVRAFGHTFGLRYNITRCSNNYGPYQFPEKLIPLMIHNALNDKELPVYGDGMQVRDWLYVDDHCRAVFAVLEKGRPGEIYNIGGNCSLPNMETVRRILRAAGRPENLIRYVTDRPGHDRRYALSSAKLTRETGWAPQIGFDEGLARTIEWYRANAPWVRHVRSGEYQRYYEQNYGNR